MYVSLFDEETRKALEDMFRKIPRTITDYLIVSSDKHQCRTCEEAIELAKELMILSRGKIKFNIFEKDSNEARKLKPRYVPAFIFDLPEKNVRYYGLPAGQEFPPFIYMHEYIARGVVKIPEKLVNMVKAIKSKLNIKIFVTPECPVCPMVVDLFNQFGIVNNNLFIEVIEAMELPWEADQYNIMYVPAVIVNDVERHEGYAPPETFIELLKRAEDKLKKGFY